MFGPPTPVLRSFDERRAREFYLEFLGFDLLFEHRFDDGAPLYMALGKDGCALHLSEHYGDATPGSAVRIPVDDVSAYMAVLRSKKFANANPGDPCEMPWGSKEITITDPAGNRLTFYTNPAERDA